MQIGLPKCIKPVATNINGGPGIWQKLVLRIYEQTDDPEVKRRALDTIDSMIELNLGGVGLELAKLES